MYYDYGKPMLYTSNATLLSNPAPGYIYCKFNSGNTSNSTWTPTSLYNNVGIYAPVNGIYYIQFTIHGSNTNGGELFISKNGMNNNDLNTTALLTTTWWTPNSPEENCSCMVYLTTNDYICVGYYSSGSSTVGGRCSISMALIQQT